MRSNVSVKLARAAGTIALSFVAVSSLTAQNRLALPEGSVILVRTATPLESATMRTNQTFETTVVEEVQVDNYTVIPAGSRIRGVATLVQPADRQRSGVIEVHFNQLTLPDGTNFPLDGKLTSTNAAERRQIDADPNARIVLVGGRGGIGAAIAGAGSENSSTSSLLAALGSMLSEARNVSVPAGTTLAVQLEQRLALSGRGRGRGAGNSTIYTGAEQIRAAQQALAQQNYYRGAVNGQLSEATQRALFEFQIDKGIMATGNLDGRTARALGLSTDAAPVAPAPGAGAMLSAADAALVRRGSQVLVARYRQELGITTAGSLDARRGIGEADVELWFALSAFSDNSSLYEQLARATASMESSMAAGRALLAAARRVDAGFQRARTSGQTQNEWASLRNQLRRIDPAYR